MVIGLNGRIPLNTAGNLAGQTGQGIPFPCRHADLQLRRRRGPRRSTWATRSARSTRPTRCRTAYDANSTSDLLGAFNSPRGTNTAVNTQVDNAGIDVRLTQLRNLLAGTRPPQKTSFGTGADGDTNFVSVESAAGSGTAIQLFMPNGVADPHRHCLLQPTQAATPYVPAPDPARWPAGGARPTRSPAGIYDSQRSAAHRRSTAT